MQNKEKTHAVRFLRPAAMILAAVLIVYASVSLIIAHTGNGETQRREALQKDVEKHIEPLGGKVSSINEKEDGVYEAVTESGKVFCAVVLNMPTRYADARCICLIDKNIRGVADSWIFPLIYADSYYTYTEENEDGEEFLVLASRATGGVVCTWNTEEYMEKLDSE